MAKKNDFDSDLLTTENISNTESVVEKLRIGLAELGLKVIADIENKRVNNPEKVYDSLVALYNAVKKN